MDIQRKLTPHMEMIEARIAHAKTLVHNTNFSSAETLIELSGEIQVEVHILQILQQDWNNTLSQVLKLYSDFLSHFGITLQ